MQRGQSHGHASHHEAMARDFRDRLVVSAAFTVPVLALSPMIQGWAGVSVQIPGGKYVLFALSAFVYGYGGYPFTTGLLREVRSRAPGMMTLVGLAITVSFLYSSAVVFGLEGSLFFWELVTLIDLMLLGHWIEMRSVTGASGALEALARLLPAMAHRVDADELAEDVPVTSLRKGDLVLVRPGESVPADGTVHHGSSSVSESLITGESAPVSKKKGDKVIGGSVNAEGSLYVKVTGTGEETYLARIMTLVEGARRATSPTQTLADRAARILTLVSLSVGALTFLAWALAGSDASYAVGRMVTVMVITCPHALGLAIPLVVAVSISIGARSGLIIRDRTAFEALRNVDTVMFDKTGTLTKGTFGVTDVLPAASYDAATLLSLAASLEQDSEHPIARAIVEHALDKKAPLQRASVFSSLVGEGITGEVDGAVVRIVGHAYLASRGQVPDNAAVEGALTEGKTVAYVFIDGTYAGAIAMADTVRETAADAVRLLKEQGIRTLMLTGDNWAVAHDVAAQIGLDDVIAEVVPEDKGSTIAALQKEGHRVCMVGDGINDAPALVQADVGIAIGAGTDVAAASADLILVRSDPAAVAASIRLSGLTYRKMKQNLFWATAYNAVAIPLAAGVLYPIGIVISPAVGAVLMSLSTVIVAANAKMMSFEG